MCRKCRIVMSLLIIAIIQVTCSFGIATVDVRSNEKDVQPIAILTNMYGEIYLVDTEGIKCDMQSISSSNVSTAITTRVTINGDSVHPLVETDANYREKWDSTMSVKAHTTIFFKTKDTPVLYLVTKATGGYSFGDLNVTVTEQKLKVACNGTFPTPVSSQIINKTPTGDSFSYTTGFTKYVKPDYGSIGATYTLTLKRNGSPWNLQLINNISPEL